MVSIDQNKTDFLTSIIDQVINYPPPDAPAPLLRKFNSEQTHCLILSKKLPSEGNLISLSVCVHCFCCCDGGGGGGAECLETMPEVVLLFYFINALVNFCLQHLSVRLPPPPSLSHAPPPPPSFRLDTTGMVD